MIAPPELIDGARVLRYAALTSATAPTGATVHYVGSTRLGPPAGLAICQYEGESGFYLFYCSQSWEVEADTYHDSVQQAMDQAELEFRGIVNAWRGLA